MSFFRFLLVGFLVCSVGLCDARVKAHMHRRMENLSRGGSGSATGSVTTSSGIPSGPSLLTSASGKGPSTATGVAPTGTIEKPSSPGTNEKPSSSGTNEKLSASDFSGTEKPAQTGSSTSSLSTGPPPFPTLPKIPKVTKVHTTPSGGCGFITASQGLGGATKTGAASNPSSSVEMCAVIPNGLAPIGDGPPSPQNYATACTCDDIVNCVVTTFPTVIMGMDSNGSVWSSADTVSSANDPMYTPPEDCCVQCLVSAVDVQIIYWPIETDPPIVQNGVIENGSTGIGNTNTGSGRSEETPPTATGQSKSAASSASSARINTSKGGGNVKRAAVPLTSVGFHDTRLLPDTGPSITGAPTGTITAEATLPPNAASPYSIVQGTMTFISPSVYVAYRNLGAPYFCPAFGPKYYPRGNVYNTTIGYPPEALSTSMCDGPPAGFQLYTAINYTQLQFPTGSQTTGTCEWRIGQSGASARGPVLSIPSDLKNIDPAWATCTGAFEGSFDPPSALSKAPAMAPTPPVVGGSPQDNGPQKPGNEAKDPESELAPPPPPVATPDPKVQEGPVKVIDNSHVDPPANDPPANNPPPPANNPPPPANNPPPPVNNPPANNGNTNQPVVNNAVVNNPPNNLPPAVKGDTNKAVVIPPPNNAVVNDPSVNNPPANNPPANNPPANNPPTNNPPANNPPANNPPANHGDTNKAVVNNQPGPVNNAVVNDPSANNPPANNPPANNPPANNPPVVNSPPAKNGDTNKAVVVNPPTVNPPINSVVVNDNTISRDPGGGVVIASSTYQPGQTAQLQGKTPVSVGQDHVVVDGSSYALPASGPTKPAPIAANAIVRASDGGIVVGTSSIAPGSVATIADHTVSAGPQAAVVDGSSYVLPSNAGAIVQAPPPPTQVPVQVDNQPVLKASNGGIVAGGTTIAPGHQAVIAGTTVSAGPSNAVVNGATYALPSAPGAPIQPAPTPPPVLDAGQSIVRAPNGGVVIGSSTIPPGSSATISGSTISVGSTAVAMNGITYALPTTPGAVLQQAPNLAQNLAASHKLTLANGAVITAGGAPAVIDGTTLAIPSNNPAALLVNGKTVPIPTTPPSSVFTVAGQIFTANPTGFAIGGHTLTPGGSALTLSGTVVSLGPSDDLRIGSSTATLLPPISSVFTVAGQTFTANPTGFAIGSQTLTEGGAPITLGGTVLSLGTAGLQVGSSTVPLNEAEQTAVAEGGLGGLIMGGLGAGNETGSGSGGSGEEGPVAFTGGVARLGSGMGLGLGTFWGCLGVGVWSFVI